MKKINENMRPLNLNRSLFRNYKNRAQLPEQGIIMGFNI